MPQAKLIAEVDKSDIEHLRNVLRDSLSRLPFFADGKQHDFESMAAMFSNDLEPFLNDLIVKSFIEVGNYANKTWGEE